MSSSTTGVANARFAKRLVGTVPAVLGTFQSFAVGAL